MEGIPRNVFWRDVVCLGDINGSVRRFVAKADLSPIVVEEEITEDYKNVVEQRIELNRDFKMFYPVSAAMDFDLVLSLCSDGSHRPLYDLDFPKENVTFKDTRPGLTRAYIDTNGNRVELLLKGSTIVGPSTNNLHVFNDEPLSFTKYLEKLDRVPGEDAVKYATNVRANGFAALRPPWVEKTDEATIIAKAQTELDAKQEAQSLGLKTPQSLKDLSQFQQEYLKNNFKQPIPQDLQNRINDLKAQILKEYKKEPFDLDRIDEIQKEMVAMAMGTNGEPF